MQRWGPCHVGAEGPAKENCHQDYMKGNLGTGKFLDLTGIKELGQSLITCFKKTILFQTSDCFELLFLHLQSRRKKTVVYLYLSVLWYSMPQKVAMRTCLILL